MAIGESISYGRLIETHTLQYKEINVNFGDESELICFLEHIGPLTKGIQSTVNYETNTAVIEIGYKTVYEELINSILSNFTTTVNWKKVGF